MNDLIKYPRRPKPKKGLLDPTFKYVPASQTNVQETWKRFGWKPKEKK